MSPGRRVAPGGRDPGPPDAGLVAGVRSRLAGAPGVPPLSAPGGAIAVPSAAAVVSAVDAARGGLGARGALEAAGPVRAALSGAGALQPLLDDVRVTDVLVNGPGQVWVDAGRGLRRVDVDVGGEAHLRALAVRLAVGCGRRLDESSPCVDGRLPDGVRLHAVLPPISPVGTLLSLRVPRRVTLDLEELVRSGSVPAPWAPVLVAVMGTRLAFLVSGGTGSGKTTVLSTLLSLADPGERVVLVEDTGELRPALPHVVRLEARQGNTDGAGSLTLAELVRQALRMRPDRLVVGECRGAEVRELLTALNTGHEGGCGTVHANTVEDVPARLEALGALAGLDRAALAAQAASALDVVLHLRRAGGPAGPRRLVGIGVVERAGDRLTVTSALEADPAEPQALGRRGPGWPRLLERLGTCEAQMWS